MIKLRVFAAIASLGAFAAPVLAGPTLDAVKQRGEIICGVSTGIAGFSAPDSRGEWTGIDVDLCRDQPRLGALQLIRHHLAVGS